MKNEMSMKNELLMLEYYAGGHSCMVPPGAFCSDWPEIKDALGSKRASKRISNIEYKLKKDGCIYIVPASESKEFAGWKHLTKKDEDYCKKLEESGWRKRWNGKYSILNDRAKTAEAPEQKTEQEETQDTSSQALSHWMDTCIKMVELSESLISLSRKILDGSI